MDVTYCVTFDSSTSTGDPWRTGRYRYGNCDGESLCRFCVIAEQSVQVRQQVRIVLHVEVAFHDAGSGCGPDRVGVAVMLSAGCDKAGGRRGTIFSVVLLACFHRQLFIFFQVFGFLEPGRLACHKDILDRLLVRVAIQSSRRNYHGTPALRKPWQ